jgi:hypothetical protein
LVLLRQRGGMSLTQYFRNNTGRPINKWVHYLPIYERYFAHYRDRPIFFLEIGSGQGGSSQMWKHYFGPAAKIVGIDVRPECMEFQDEQVAVRIGDQADPMFLQSVIDEFGAPDIVLDDGSHLMGHTKASFAYLYPRMARDAVYLVEDMHTAYWPDFEGGLRKAGTFIEDMKHLVDEINSRNPHHAAQTTHPLPSSPISKATRGLHFYESIVVIEKGPFIATQEHSIPAVDTGTIW